MWRRPRPLRKPRSIGALGYCLALIFLAACNALWGVDDLAYVAGAGGTAASGGAGGAGGAGGEGGSAACAEGETLACYDGPPEVRGKGSCVEGTRTCADGSFGPCVGSVEPAFDDCATRADEDCDEMVEPCTGDLLQGRAFGSGAHDRLFALAVDDGGAVALAGRVVGNLGFDGQVVSGNGTAGSQCCGYVAKLDASLQTIWAVEIGPAADLDLVAIDIDDDGDVIVAGSFEGTLTLEQEHAAPNANDELILFKLAGEDGSVIWSRSAGGAHGELATAVVAEGDRIVVGGHGGVGVDFGGGPLPLSENGVSPFVAVLDADGQHVASWGFPINGSVDSVDLTGGLLAVGGRAEAPLDHAAVGGPLLPHQDGVDGFAFALDLEGMSLRWARAVQGTGFDEVDFVGVTPSGEAVVAVRYAGTITVDDRIYTATIGADTLVVGLTAEGEERWAVTLNGDHRIADELHLGPGGSTVVVGDFGGSLEVDGAPLLDGQSYRAFAVKLSPTGEAVWGVGLGGGGDNAAVAVAGDAFDRLVVGVELSGSAALGGQSWSTAGGLDLLLLSLAP